MSPLKQIIINAFIKVTETLPTVDHTISTIEQLRENFLTMLIAELFPENPTMPPKDDLSSAMEKLTIEIPVVPLPPSPKAKKPRAPMSEEAKAAAKAKKEAKKKADEPKKEEEKADEPKKEPKKPKAEKKEKPKAEDLNLAKIDPTWRKHLKKSAGDSFTKEQETQLLTFLNGLTKEEFNAKKSDEHIQDFLSVGKKTAEVVEEKVEAELEEVEFNGKGYFVNPETKRVYEGEGEYSEEVGWTDYKPVGYVGMAAFAEMKL